MLLGTSHGVYVINDSHFDVLNIQAGLAADDARVIINDNQGDIWIGGYGGLTKLSSDLVPKERWTEQNGLPSNNIRSLYEDPAGNIWVGTTMEAWDYFAMAGGLRLMQPMPIRQWCLSDT